MTDNNKLDERIDSLAVDVERQIQKNQETLNSLDHIDPTARRMQEADIAEVFTDA